MRASWGLCLLFSGCFNPNLDGGHYACDPSQGGGDCPSGFACQAGVCKRPANTPAPPDLSVSPPDLSTPDLFTEDLRPLPDLRQADDLATAKPCGTFAAVAEVVPGVFACAGSFALGKYASLCGVGYHVCGVSDRMLIRVESEITCKNLLGFYATTVSGGLLNLAPRCPYLTGDTPALFGCGAETGAVAVGSSLQCEDQPDVVLCKGAGTPWSCNTGINDASHNGVNGGVLCCAG